MTLTRITEILITSMLRFPRGELGTVRVLLPIPSSRRNLMKNTHKVLRFIYFIILQRSQIHYVHTF
jgi:hypothetical protein